MEIYIQCSCKGGEMRFGEGEDWLEILGCGMVHRTSCEMRLDPDIYQGFAWGVGVDRIAHAENTACRICALSSRPTSAG